MLILSGKEYETRRFKEKNGRNMTTEQQIFKVDWVQFQKFQNKTFGNENYYLQNEKLNAAKALQSCPTLCDPIDGSPKGSPLPGILQARTLEWVAISFSNA